MANEIIKAFKSVQDALETEASAEGLLANITVREFTPGDIGQSDCPLILYKLDSGEELKQDYVGKTVQMDLKFSILLHEDSSFGNFYLDDAGEYSRGILWLLERSLNAIDKAYFDNDTQLKTPSVRIKEFTLDNNIKGYVIEIILNTELYERGTL